MKIAGLPASQLETLGIMLLRAEDNEPIPRAEVTLGDVWDPDNAEEGEAMEVWEAHNHPEVAYITVALSSGQGDARNIVNIDCLDAYSAIEVIALHLDGAHCRHNLDMAISGKAADGKELSTDYRLMLATEARQKALPWARLAKPAGCCASTRNAHEHSREPAEVPLHGVSHVQHPDSASWTLFSMLAKGGGGRTQTQVIALNPESIRAVREMRDELASIAEAAAQLRRHLISGIPTAFELTEAQQERDLTPTEADVRDLDDLSAHVEAEGIEVGDDADGNEIFAAATALAGDGLPFRGRRQARALVDLMSELRSSQRARP